MGGLAFGTVTGHRGRSGEITVRVVSGAAGRWTGLEHIGLGTMSGATEYWSVEHGRAYRDRLVLKLQGVDDAGAASELKGRVAWAREAEVPALETGEFYQDRLLGLEVFEEGAGRRLGRVDDVIETGGTDVLVIGGDRGEVLVPLARAFVVAIDERARKLVVRLPEGLEEINRQARDDRS